MNRFESIFPSSSLNLSISVAIQVKDVLLSVLRCLDVTVKSANVAAFELIDFACEFILCPSFCVLLMDQLLSLSNKSIISDKDTVTAPNAFTEC